MLKKSKVRKNEGFGIDYKIPYYTIPKKENLKSYKVLLPISKNKKSNIRGLFKDKKLFYDYLKIKKYNKINYKILEYLKKSYNQLCIFYKTNQSQAFIYYTPKKIIKLNYCQYFRIPKKENLKSNLKRLVKKYQGLTIYDKIKFYLVEVWGA